MENLEELRELNMRQSSINHEEILKQGAELEAQSLREQEEEDEAEIRYVVRIIAVDCTVYKTKFHLLYTKTRSHHEEILRQGTELGAQMMREQEEEDEAEIRY